MFFPHSDANVTEVSPEDGSVANMDIHNDRTAGSVMANVAAAANNDMTTPPLVDMIEAPAAGPLSSAAPAALLTSDDMTPDNFQSANNSDCSSPSAMSGDQPMWLEPELNDAACLFVVQCSQEGDDWALATCLMALALTFIGDGVFLSLFLFDSRFGIADRVPPGTRTLEHMAIYALFFYAIGPFACALVNRHGFRTMMFLGSMLTIAWSACLWSVNEVFVDNRGLFLAVVGGTGAGLMRTSFTILLSLLYNLSRQKVHLCMDLGGFSGMMIVAPLTEYSILLFKWKTALMINMMPQKIEVVADKPKVIVEHPVQRKAAAVAKNAQSLEKNHYFPTVWNTVGNRKLRVVPFTADTPVLSRIDNLRSIGLLRLGRLYTVREPEMYVRNLNGCFGPTLVGSRPMYRDDVLYTGNIFNLLNENLKVHLKIQSNIRRARRVYISNGDELNGWTKLCPTSVRRTFNSIMNPNIWGTVPFILFAASEFLVHAACFLPLMFIKGPPGMMKSSWEAVITLIAGCYGMLTGRGLGFVLHETTATAVPIYTVSIVLIANGLSLFLSATADLARILPYFAIYGIFFGYYNSVQIALVYNVFPVHLFNNVFGYIYLVRALGSCFGILIAVKIQEDCQQSNENVYMYAGMLMFTAGICVGFLQAAVNCKTMADRESSSTLYNRYPDAVYPTSIVTKVTACPPILIT
ncbi:uncharacterized protein LOC126841985 [Adelges cooleyi]|uniref:uncharacterized protein LOC126841985 n=1 Tax=Adelges cooleyi TaxID=133065 RepID=UPI00217FC240|nr:uncharacterized protein LOC126841985 [Adelges cooleyi]